MEKPIVFLLEFFCYVILSFLSTIGVVLSFASIFFRSLSGNMRTIGLNNRHSLGMLKRTSEATKRKFLASLFFEERLFFADYFFKKKILPYLKHSSLALDVGTGEGQQARLLGRHCEKVVAFDVDVQFVKRALSYKLGKNIDFIVCDARFMPLVSRRFDFVLCREVIEHIREDDLVFSEVARVSRENATLIFTTPFSLFFQKYEYPLTKILKRTFLFRSLPHLGPFLKGEMCPSFSSTHGHVRLGYSQDYFRKVSGKHNFTIKKVFFRNKKPIGALFFELQQCFPKWIAPIYTPFTCLVDYFDDLQDGEGFDLITVLKAKTV